MENELRLTLGIILIDISTKDAENIFELLRPYKIHFVRKTIGHLKLTEVTT